MRSVGLTRRSLSVIGGCLILIRNGGAGRVKTIFFPKVLQVGAASASDETTIRFVVSLGQVNTTCPKARRDRCCGSLRRFGGGGECESIVVGNCVQMASNTMVNTDSTEDNLKSKRMARKSALTTVAVISRVYVGSVLFGTVFVMERISSLQSTRAGCFEA
ncbi:hypothetical protein BDN71DRAFT_1063018 [Pleurotus eryngii]|uniref:Uncharacterized protein n=1 Tax=Pleurotus eryngii TaxID=5323 RepID=A0A9P5ZV12_PLEER|nr:hypothetical protein BDN71DRAFT_1063018 [Pleurotus eryngii]